MSAKITTASTGGVGPQSPEIKDDTVFGFLNVNKGRGQTSRQVVTTVHRLIRPAKVGHAGTLDPLATGVLMLSIGPATRLTRFIQQQPKTYVGDFRLGQTSDSLDTETEIRILPDAPQITREELQTTLPEFTGEIQQAPPAYSAIKINGKRAYELARQGNQVEIAARPIQIHSLKLLEFSYPDFQLEIVCGSGTYVRSLGRDIGASVGSTAIMTGLVRTAIGSNKIEDAIDSAEIDSDLMVQEHLLPPIMAFPDHMKVEVDSATIRRIRDGCALPESTGNAAPEIVAVSANGLVVAFMSLKPGLGYTPSINFAKHHVS